MIASVVIADVANASDNTRVIDIFIGDSTTDGYGLDGYEYGNYEVISKINNWPKLFCQKDNAVCANYAHGGSGFLTQFDYTKQYEQAMKEQRKSDIRRIFFVGASNDLLSGQSATAELSAITKLLTRAHDDNPNAQIIFIPEIMPLSNENKARLSQWNQAVNILISSVKSIQGVSVPSDWQSWLKSNEVTWQSDKRHPNALGHQLAAESAEKWINTTSIPLGGEVNGNNSNESFLGSRKTNIYYRIIVLVVFFIGVIIIGVAYLFLRSKKRRYKR